MVKKILIIVTKGELGGAQQAVLSLAKGLKQNGFSVTVGFGSGSYLSDALAKANIHFKKFKYLHRTVNPFLNFLFIFELRRYLHDTKFDMVHFNSSNSIFGALALRLIRPHPKALFTVHGLSVIDPHYKVFFLVKFLYTLFFKFFLHFFDTVIFVSNADYSFARTRKLTTKGLVVHNGIESTEYLSRDEARNKLSQYSSIPLENHFLIGSIGRLSYQKNYEFLITVWPLIKKKFSGMKLVIVGTGPKQKKLHNLINHLGLENDILLTGAIPNASQYLKAFDIFVLPSRYEGMSLTLIESLSAGIPALATDIKGNIEVLSDAGMTYHLNDAQDFLDSLTRLIQDHKLRTQLSKHAVARSANFSSETMIERYREIFSNRV